MGNSLNEPQPVCDSSFENLSHGDSGGKENTVMFVTVLASGRVAQDKLCNGAGQDNSESRSQGSPFHKSKHSSMSAGKSSWLA